MPVLLLLSVLLLPQSGEPGADPPERVVVIREAALPAERPLFREDYPRLLAALGDDGIPGNAEDACRELLARGEDARPHLYGTLEDADPQRRFLAAWTLAFVGPDDLQLEKVCRTLIPVLGDDDVPGNGLMAGEALRALDERAVPWLQSALRHEQGQLRQAVLKFAGGRHPYRYTTAYGQKAVSSFLLGDCRTADWAKPRLSPPADSREMRMAYLVQRLGAHPQWWVEAYVHREIRVEHADHARPYLLGGLHDPDRRVRHSAVHLLRRMEPAVLPTQRMIEVSVEALEDDDIRANAGRSSYALVRHYMLARPEVLRAIRSDDPLVRYRAAMIAAQAGEQDLETWVPALIEALAEDDIVANGMGASRTLAQRPRTRPWVERIRVDGTPQQRALASRILAIQERVLAGEELPFAWRVDFLVGDMRRPGR